MGANDTLPPQKREVNVGKRLFVAIGAFLASTMLFGQDGRFEKTIAFPRDGDARLDWTFSTRMRTVEAADAPKVRLRAEIVPK